MKVHKATVEVDEQQYRRHKSFEENDGAQPNRERSDYGTEVQHHHWLRAQLRNAPGGTADFARMVEAAKNEVLRFLIGGFLWVGQSVKLRYVAKAWAWEWPKSFRTGI